MKLRLAIEADLPAIVDIYNSTIPGRMVTADTEPVTATDKRTWFLGHHSRRPLWVAEEDNMVIAWASLQDFYSRPAYEGTAEISIYLHPDYRGQGKGRALLQQTINLSREIGIHSLVGFIFSHNTPSIQLFESTGFENWGLLPGIAHMDDKVYSLEILGLKL